MSKKILIAAMALGCMGPLHGQMGRTLDWVTYGGDAQRTGWEKSDARFTKDDVAKGFQFLWKLTPPGRHTLLAPVIVGNLIGYRGFKELAFIGSTDGWMYVMDSDLDRMYWQKHIDADHPASGGSGACSGGLMPMPTLMAFSFRRPRPAGPGGRPAGRPSPNPMFGPRSIYVIAGDGQLHRVNVANGEDAVPPAPVLPRGARASTLNMHDNVIYTTTGEGCGGAPNAVWAVDLTADPLKVASWRSPGGGFVGLGGPVIGEDGTIYAQATDRLVALSPRDLQVKASFQRDSAGVTPVVFPYQDRELVVTGGKDGRLNLLEAHSLALLSQTPPLEGSPWGSLSSWQDADDNRWVLATVWDSSGRDGSLVAFRLAEKDGKPALSQAWSSGKLVRPSPPVVASGVVFALANGDGQAHAVLHALDGSNGKELWSTGSGVSAPGALTGLTVANGRVYFATADGTMWVYGIPLEW